MQLGNAKAVKTNAMRALDGRKVPYTAFVFDDAIRSADGVAATLGLPEHEVYKTLVALSETAGRKPMLVLVMIPANRELDLRRLARATGEKAVRMATQREAETLTGLKVGGISALALLGRGFTVYLDASAQALDALYVSGGQRGVDLRLKVADLITVTGATVVEVAEAETETD